jgi:hypothetical protein
MGLRHRLAVQTRSRLGCVDKVTYRDAMGLKRINGVSSAFHAPGACRYMKCTQELHRQRGSYKPASVTGLRFAMSVTYGSVVLTTFDSAL